MVDGGMSGRRGEMHVGGAAWKQQMAVDNTILYVVNKRSRNKGDMDLSGMEERDDLGVRDRVDDLISSIVGLAGEYLT